MGISASTLHAVLAPGAHRNVSDFVHKSLLRCWLAWATRNSWTHGEILGPGLDLRVFSCLVCRILAGSNICHHILRLLMTCLMGVVQGGYGSYARRRVYRGRVKPWLVLVFVT